MNKDEDLTINVFLSPMFDLLVKKVTEMGADKYVKKLRTVSLIILMVYGQLTGITSFSGLALVLNTNEDLQKLLKLKSISPSQLSRRLSALPPELVFELYRHLVGIVLVENSYNTYSSQQKIKVIDSSTITMAMSQYPWALYKTTKSGIKIHLRVVFIKNEGGVLPDHATITNAKMADRKQLDLLVIEDDDALYIFDRAYVDYEKFDEYTGNGIRFLTRLKGNACKDTINTRTMIINGKVVKESIVKLGREGRNQTSNVYRLIETEDDAKPYTIIQLVTNDFDMSIKEILDLYRERWKIETFFKWIKQHLNVKILCSTSPNGVINQIWCAIITYLLIDLLKKRSGTNKILFEVLRTLQQQMFYVFRDFVITINKDPSRTSRGRRRLNYNQIFDFTYQQVMRGEYGHLNQLEYDPVVI